MNYSNKTALIVCSPMFAYLAERLARDFGTVYLYTPTGGSFPSMNAGMVGTGLEGVTKVDSIFGPHFDSVDLFVFPDLGHSAEQIHLESLGKRVWGGRNGEELENYREVCKGLMEQAGLPVQPWKKLTGMDALREHLKMHDNQHVKFNRWRGVFETFRSENYDLSQVKLDKIAHDLGAFQHIADFIVEDDIPDAVEIGTDLFIIDGQLPSKTIVGIEVKDMAYVGEFIAWDDIPEPIRRWNEQMAPCFAQYGYRGWLCNEIRITDDHEPYMIDATCFDDQTEVLTDHGWKLFKDCENNDRLATINTANSHIEYQLPSQYIAKPHKGKMVHISNRAKSIECLVTPDHDVLRMDRDKKRMFKEKASSLTQKGFIPRSGIWPNQPCEDYFMLPEYHHEWDFIGQYGHAICRKVHHDPALSIPMKDWASFLGWYIAEGSLGGHSTFVTISQVKHRDEVTSTLSRLPFKFSWRKDSVQIHSKQLAQYLIKYGLCDKKFVPDYIKFNNVSVIKEFLRAYRLGDGTDRGNGSMIYYTTSPVLADDVQEMILKCGSVANIAINYIKGTKMSVGSGKTYIRNHDVYLVRESSTHPDFWFETNCRKSQYINEVDYEGTVYCATVPNGTLYVRRNGKPFWSGNCRQPSPPGELLTEFYTNYADILWHGAEGKLVDPIPAAKFGVEVIMKSEWAKDNWQPVEFDPQYADQIKLYNKVVVEGKTYVVPQGEDMSEIGAVIGWGDTLEEAMEHMEEAADTVAGFGIKIPKGSLDEARASMQKLADCGLPVFTLESDKDSE